MEFYCDAINNIITDNYMLVVDQMYVIIWIVDNTLEPERFVLKSIICNDETVSFRFVPLNGFQDIIITTNYNSEEERDWYILDEYCFCQFKEMHNELYNFINYSQRSL